MRSGAAVRLLLRLSARLVPRAERNDWLREWQAEFENDRRSRGGTSISRDLRRSIAAFHDAVCLRRDIGGWERWSVRAALAGLARDSAFTVRRLRREPWTSLLIVGILGVGLGANVAIYSLVRSLFYQPLAVHEPERLLRVYNRFIDGFEWAEVSLLELRDYERRTDIVEEAFGEAYTFVDLGLGTERELAFASVASPSYFQGLGIRPALGRLLGPSDDMALGGHAVAVVSHAFWAQRMAGDTRALGRRVVVNGREFEIVGVAPAGFTGTMRGLNPTMWLPASMHATVLPGSRWYEEPANAALFGLVRVRPGVSVRTARDALDAMFQARKEEKHSQYQSHAGLSVIPEVEGNVHPYYRGLALRFVTMLRGAVALLLCLACANAAGLLLATAAARRGEFSVRLALGVGRGGLFRQLLVEAGVLAVAAGITGTMLAAVWARVASGARMGTDVPLAFHLDLDGQVVLFAIGATLVTALLSGCVPAVIATRANIATVLRASAVGRARSPLRSALVVGQIAMSCALLVGAGLLFRGLQAAADMDSGFDADGVVAGSLAPSLHGYDAVGGLELQRALSQRLESAPGIESVTFTSWKPFGLDPSVTRVDPEGHESPDGVLPTSDFAVVDWRYAGTLRIPVVDGRFLSEFDRVDSERVAVVNEAFAQRFWPGQEAVGRRVRVWGTWRRVVGLTATGKYRSLGEDPRPFFYLPMEQEPRERFHVHARGSLPSDILIGILRDAVHDLDPALTLALAGELADAAGLADLLPRVGIVWLGSLGSVALLLAAVGLYGLLAWSVVRRRREMGTRIALGAPPSRVVAMVVREGVWLAIAGLALAIPLSLLVGQAMSAWLYGVRPTDVWAWTAGAVVGLIVAVTASLLPAWRASRVDPLAAIRAS